jgi:hypothetical protein
MPDINVSGVWKSTAPGINVAGVWKTPEEWINVTGVWKKTYPTGPAVSAVNGGDTNIRILATCYAGVQFNSNGYEYECINTGSYTQNIGLWLDAGAASEVWVECIVTAGSWNSIDPGAGRHTLASSKTWRVQRSSIGVQSVTCYFRFWDAASGGNLLQTTATNSYAANYESGA